MKYVVLVINIVIFIAVLVFALNNVDGVDVSLLPNYTFTQVPLIVVILIAVVVGVILALLLTLPRTIRSNRERSKLRSENRSLIRKIENIQRELTIYQQDSAAKPSLTAQSAPKSSSTKF